MWCYIIIYTYYIMHKLTQFDVMQYLPLFVDYVRHDHLPGCFYCESTDAHPLAN